MQSEDKTTYWRARHRAVCEAEGDKWDRLCEAYDADWKEAYRAAFRAAAKARGWPEDHIESGWLDLLPNEAHAHDHYRTPAEAAADDVRACEEAASYA
jgi:hypothetical protein